MQQEKGFGLRKPALFCIVKRFANSKILPGCFLLPMQIFYAMKSKMGRICEVCSHIVDASSVLWSLQIAVHCENYTSFKWCFFMKFPTLKYYLVLKTLFLICLC